MFSLPYDQSLNCDDDVIDILETYLGMKEATSIM